MKKEIYKEKLELKEVSIDNDVPFIAVNCPSCNEQVSADHVDIGKAVAKCGSCHVLFPIEDTISKLSKSSAREEKPLLQPKGVDVFEYKDQLEISIGSHYSWIDIVMAFCGFFFFMATLGSTIELLEAGSFSFIVFGILLLLMMGPLYWFMSVRKRNKLYFNVTQNSLKIEARPKYFRKDKRFDINSIEQLYVSGVDLFLVTNDYGERTHVRLYRSNNVALLNYLEKRIEKHLGIEDMQHD